MSLLLSSINLNGLTLKNKVVMSPMCMYEVKNEDGIPTPFHYAHYGARAIGGIGLIILEATAVHPDGRLTNYDLGLWNDEQMVEMQKLVTFLHTLGAKVGVQLVHAGRKAQHAKTPLAPSPLPFSAQYNDPTEMTIEQIESTILDFKNAAKRAQDIGFDMIELHGAHGYLINQFLEPHTNQRTDDYGGTLEKRYTFLKRTLNEVQSVFNGHIWTRLSVSAYLPENQQNHLDDYATLAKWLEDDGVHALDISSGGLCDIRPNITIETGYQVPFAKHIKQHVSIPVGAVGLLDDPLYCESILQNGDVDFILQGRSLLRHPEWLMHAKHVLSDDTFKPYNPSYERAYPHRK